MNNHPIGAPNSKVIADERMFAMARSLRTEVLWITQFFYTPSYHFSYYGPYALT